ncbi:hypothetical protein E2C01_042755 [Portunus trituberculatus]|uniref:Uncharacterized protein n=1 Tax=Portunus trituberculatus TaxID=210409 RepID=A0A5B7FUG8_PORTR|nr:hypothetical protein [Portunus trituberculatus]
MDGCYKEEQMVPFCSQLSNNHEHRILKSDAVPSQFRWTQPFSPSVKTKINRAQKRKRSNNVSHELIWCHSTDDCKVGAEVEVGTIDQVGAKVEELQNELATASVGTMTEQPPSANSLLSLTEKKPIITIDMLMEDEKALHFYTGLENSAEFSFVF